jgi:hypothetical protein
MDLRPLRGELNALRMVFIEKLFLACSQAEIVVTAKKS